MTTDVADDFTRLADPYRRELLAHCYRMLGSVHDAEDLLQETYLRAWRGFDAFEGRSSLRTWLYRIATRTCLTALESRGRRPMPTDLTGPATAGSALVERSEVPWLQPAPDVAIGAFGVTAADPATIATSRDSVRLAFIAAMQHLPPQQRAVLLLRDVMRWRAAEVADLLGITAVAVNSALQRARATLHEVAPSEDDVEQPNTARERELLRRWSAAFEDYDIPAIVGLLTTDSVWEMPPFENWINGASNIGTLISTTCPATCSGDMRLMPTAANGQPAFAVYLRDPDSGEHTAFALQVLTLAASGVRHTGMFFDTSLYPAFGLPPTLAAKARERAARRFG
ncbi:MAG: sigma-70 family RNA polymerase sigma factor [Actinophytocola sp.]|nr:sigma-70 family RNA polymerase sigma factor [Actinophytocola sp.]